MEEISEKLEQPSKFTFITILKIYQQSIRVPEVLCLAIVLIVVLKFDIASSITFVAGSNLNLDLIYKAGL